MTDKQPTQAMGSKAPDGAATPDGTNRPGETSAYPNPHTGKTERGEGGKMSGFMGHGGQSGMGYHGHGQLGEETFDDVGNSNAPTQDRMPD